MPEIILMSDPRVASNPVVDNQEPLVELRLSDTLLLDARKADPEGFRQPALQRHYFDEYLDQLRPLHPDLNAWDLHSLASRYVSPPDIAPHSAAAAFGSPRKWPSIALAATAGRLTMVGYYGTAALRGFGVNSFWLLFWCTAGIAVGAAIGEAAHGLLRVADSTPVGYWWVEAGVAVAVLCLLSIGRIRSTRGVVVAIATTTLSASTMFIVYALL